MESDQGWFSFGRLGGGFHVFVREERGGREGGERVVWCWEYNMVNSWLWLYLCVGVGLLAVFG